MSETTGTHSHTKPASFFVVISHLFFVLHRLQQHQPDCHSDLTKWKHFEKKNWMLLLSLPLFCGYRGHDSFIHLLGFVGSVDQRGRRNYYGIEWIIQTKISLSVRPFVWCIVVMVVPTIVSMSSQQPQDSRTKS